MSADQLRTEDDVNTALRIQDRTRRTPREEALTLDVAFKPHERSIHYVRLMAHNFALLGSGDQPLASRITVTCAELVAGVGRRFEGSCGLRIRLNPSDKYFAVEVEGQLADDSLRSLRGAIEAISVGSPVEAYTRALTAPSAGEELLGLARVRYEGKTRLALKTFGSRATVSAEEELGAAAS